MLPGFPRLQKCKFSLLRRRFSHDKARRNNFKSHKARDQMATSTQTVGVIPPPPGVQANFLHPPTPIKGTIALHTICLFFVTACVMIRMYTRRYISHNLGLDDGFCLVAYILTIVMSILSIIAVTRGLGRHMWDIPASQISGIFEVLTWTEYVYLLLVALIKFSYLMLYRRIFSPSMKMKRFFLIGMYFIGAAYIGIFFGTVFHCVPIQKVWNENLPGHCGPPKGLPYASGAINVVSDIYILVAPIPCVWSLNMKLHRKLRVLSIFSLGAFACATSIVRLVMSQKVHSSKERLRDDYQIFIYMLLEVNVGMICLCLLTFPPLLKHYEGVHVHGLGLGPFLTKLTARLSSWPRDSCARFFKPDDHHHSMWRWHHRSKPKQSNNTSIHIHIHEDDHDRDDSTLKEADPNTIRMQTTSNVTEDSIESVGLFPHERSFLGLASSL